jgi:hypothetical protein
MVKDRAPHAGTLCCMKYTADNSTTLYWRGLILVPLFAWALASSPGAAAAESAGDDLVDSLLNAVELTHYQPVSEIPIVHQNDWTISSLIVLDNYYGANRWAYSSSLRYTVSERHTVGLATTFPLGDAATPRLALGYRVTASETWSVKLTVWTTL